MFYGFNVPVKINVKDKSELFKEIKDRFHGNKILIVASNKMIERAGFIPTIEKIKENNVVFHINDIKYNPNNFYIAEVLNKIKNVDFDVVIAIGGGSAIDLAKSIIALDYLNKNNKKITHDEVKENIIGNKYKNQIKKVDFIAIPTTAGTGSEVTPWATVWDFHKENKWSIESEELYPSEVYIVSQLTLTLPKRIILSSTLDALAHAAESYWSKRSNDITRELSKVAINKITKNLEEALKDPTNLNIRKELTMASLFAGLAFANTRTTVCHSISYPLTMKYEIDHGFAVAITLTEVMRYNKEYIVEYDKFIEAFNVKDINEVEEWLSRISNSIQKLKLRFFGIDKDDIRDIVNKASTKGRIDNNIRELTKEDIKNILINCY